MSKIPLQAQVIELLIKDGDTLHVTSNLRLSDIIDNHPPEVILEQYKEIPPSSWEGLRVIWKLRNDSLYLQGIFDDAGKNHFKRLGINENGRIFAEWFNRTFFNHYGKEIYLPFANELLYSFERNISFQGGRLSEISVYDNSASVLSPYSDGAKMTEFLAKNIDYRKLPDFDSVIKVYVSFGKTDEHGKILDAGVIKGHSELFDNEALRIINRMKWNVLYKHGERYYPSLIVPVTFNPDHD